LGLAVGGRNSVVILALLSALSSFRSLAASSAQVLLSSAVEWVGVVAAMVVVGGCAGATA